MMAFALIEEQYGFALEVADFASDHLKDRSFDQWRSKIIARIKSQSWKIPFVIIKRQINKLLSGIHD
jgi:hypothetical protein